MTDGTHSLILCPPAAGKFYLQSWMEILLWAGSRPTVFPLWGAGFLPGVLIASWVLHSVYDPWLKAGNKEMQGTIQRCSHRGRVGRWNGKSPKDRAFLCWEQCRCITVTYVKAIKWCGKGDGSSCFLFPAVSFLNPSWWDWQGQFSTPSHGSLSFKKNKYLGARKQFWINCCFIEVAVCAEDEGRAIIHLWSSQTLCKM